jgi:stalled ribosome alternative rescue factor ArfA
LNGCKKTTHSHNIKLLTLDNKYRICYNYGMDKKFTIKLEKPKSRNHYMLFCTDTPFKPKVEKCKKKSYSRKTKHRKDNYD